MRIVGITIPENKRLKVGLTVLYGIGLPKARQILAEAKVSPDKKGNEVTLDEEARIRKIVESIKIEGDLKTYEKASSSRTKNKDQLKNTQR